MFFLIGLVTSTQVLAYPFIAERSSPLITATSLSVASFVIMGGQGVFRWVYGIIIDWHSALRGTGAAYNASDFNAATWMLPATILLAIAAIAVTKAKSRKQV